MKGCFLLLLVSSIQLRLVSVLESCALQSLLVKPLGIYKDRDILYLNK